MVRINNLFLYWYGLYKILMNKNQQILNKKIGILGGGQLGKMLCIAGAPMGINISVLDQKRDFPAGSVTPFFTEGSFLNYHDVMSFGKNLDIITIEIENVNTDALKDLELLGKKVYPQPGVIEMIKDKGKQKIKTILSGCNIPAVLSCQSHQHLLQQKDGHFLSLPFSCPVVHPSRQD